MYFKLTSLQAEAYRCNTYTCDYDKHRMSVLPVQCNSYVGLSVGKMRTIVNEVVKAMNDRGMAINGVFPICWTIQNIYYIVFQGLFQTESTTQCW